MNRQLRIYTKRNLKPGFFDNFLRKHSITTWLIITNVIVFIIAFSLIAFLGETSAEKIFSLIKIGLLITFYLTIQHLMMFIT